MKRCGCGCGRPVGDRRGRPSTFLAGHNRRAQGRLLAQLSRGLVDVDALALYTSALRRRPSEATMHRSGCLCCGAPTTMAFTMGHGIRFGDALLCSLAGHPVRWTRDDGTSTSVAEVVDVWRSRQSPNAARRDRRHGMMPSSGQSAFDSSTNRRIPDGERACTS